jgi:hypothetical protein
MNETTRAALTSFINAAQAMIVAHTAERFPGMEPRLLVEDIGRKYARIWAKYPHETSRGSAYCFVDMTNGDILKPATWKAPAKHARGNIFRGDAVKAVNPYGTNYLR